MWLCVCAFANWASNLFITKSDDQLTKHPFAYLYCIHRTAEQIKAEANQEYKAGNYAAAVDLYSQSIKLEPTNATYYGNRSAALMMIKKYSDASKDCLTAVRLDPAFVKVITTSSLLALTLFFLYRCRPFLVFLPSVS